MIKPCCSELRGWGECKKGGLVDTAKHAYQTNELRGINFYWHAICYEGNHLRLVPLTNETKQKLLDFIYESFPDPKNRPEFVNDALLSLEEPLIR